VDEYSTESEKPVSESERDPLAHYFQLLITRLMNNEEISEEAQQEMAREAGISEKRIDDVANFSINGATSNAPSVCIGKAAACGDCPLLA
jgi:hypothetical protein